MWDSFLDYAAGYGRKPENAIYWCIFLIGVGTFVFRIRNMEPKAAKEDNPAQQLNYCSFLYSLAMFVPIVNLQFDDWRPKRTMRLVNIYLRIHIMLGWVFVTISVATLTGILK
jgi:hypothetical protein